MLIETAIAVLGAGGHAKVVLDALLASTPSCQVAVFDDAPEKAASQLAGHAIHVPIPEFATLPPYVHVAIGANEARRKYGTAIMGVGKHYLTVTHPSASVSRFASVQAGGFVAANAVVAAGAGVGVGAIVNHGAVVDHDCRVGDWSHIAPGVVLGGGVRIGNQCLVGSGAVILPGLCVADGAIVGAGSVVTRNVQAGAVMVGAPARPRGQTWLM